MKHLKTFGQLNEEFFFLEKPTSYELDKTNDSEKTQIKEFGGYVYTTGNVKAGRVSDLSMGQSTIEKIEEWLKVEHTDYNGWVSIIIKTKYGNVGKILGDEVVDTLTLGTTMTETFDGEEKSEVVAVLS